VLEDRELRRVLGRLLDEGEFLAPWGIRSLSKHHEGHPLVLGTDAVRYEPAESDAKLKGGNSNWRGPVWLPASFLAVEALRELGAGFGPAFRVPAPGDPCRSVALQDVARDLADRAIRLFTRDARGRRPIFGRSRPFQDDAHWRDHLLFFEYFHGDDGAGLGASHQTGWTALVASLLDEWRR
jgi:hypothetical protein